MTAVRRTSNTAAVIARLRPAQTRGLLAAARVLSNRLKIALRHGYHSSLGNWGDFTTGNNFRHIRIGQVVFTGDGGQVRVGTDLLYPLYWELGHHNIFTRNFERDEKWGPTYRVALPYMREAFHIAFFAAMKGAARPAEAEVDE